MCQACAMRGRSGGNFTPEAMQAQQLFYSQFLESEDATVAIIQVFVLKKPVKSCGFTQLCSPKIYCPHSQETLLTASIMAPKKRKAVDAVAAEPAPAATEEPLIELPQAPQAAADEREIPGLDPADPYYIEKSRLLTKDTVFLGRSCKAALLEFQAFANAACALNRNDADALDQEAVDALRNRALRELRVFSVEIKKQKLQARACSQEIADCERLERETTTEIAEAEKRIQQLRERLKEERATRARKEEYEALAKLINKLPSQKESKQAIDALEADCAYLEAKKARLDALYNEKSARVAGVLQMLDDLERSELEEELAAQIEEKREATLENEKRENEAAAVEDGDVAMEEAGEIAEDA